MADLVETNWTGLIEVRFATRDYDTLTRPCGVCLGKALGPDPECPLCGQVAGKTGSRVTAEGQMREYIAGVHRAYRDVNVLEEKRVRVAGLRVAAERADVVVLDRTAAMKVQEALTVFEDDSHHCVACGARNMVADGDPGWAEGHGPGCAYVELTRTLVEEVKP